MINEKNHKMEQLNEKFEIEYMILEKRSNGFKFFSENKRRSITRDDLWMANYKFNSLYDQIIWSKDGKIGSTFVLKDPTPTISIFDQVKALMIKAEYEVGGEKYQQGKEEFEKIH